MKRRLAAVAAALVFVVGSAVGGAQPASAYVNGATYAYTNSGYSVLAKSWPWGLVGDCDAATGFVFWSGAYVQYKMSSAWINVGGRVHCNWFSVRSGVAGFPYASKCISPGDPGFNWFGPPWNDNTDAIVVQWNPGCPLNQ